VKPVKYLGWVFGVLLASMLVLALFVSYATCSESGLRWLSAQAEKWTQDQLTVGEVHGCLWDVLEVKELRYETPEQIAALQQAKLDWHARRLIEGRLSIEQIHLQGLRFESRVKSAPKETEEAPFALPELPIAIEINRFELLDASIQTDPDAQPLVIDNVSARMRLTPENYAIDELKVKLPGIEAELTGGIRPEPHFPLNLQARWRVAKPELTAQGKLSGTGDLDKYRLELSTALAGTQIPEGRWTLTGEGNTIGFSLEKLRGDLLGGYLEAAGRIGWQTGFDWDLTLKGEALNPGLHWKEWPGQLALKGHLPGRLVDGRFTASLEGTEVSGQLRGKPFTLRTEATVTDSEAMVETLELRSGGSRLHAQGRVGDPLDLGWNIDSPNLAELYPKARGRLKGEGRVSGPQSAPAVTGKLEGHGIVAEEARVGKLTANWSLDLSRGQKFNIDMAARDAAIGGRTIQTFSLKGSGTAAQHRIQTTLVTPEQAFLLAAQGGMANQAWSGQITSGELTDKLLGRWRLASPASLMLSTEAAKLGQFCWAAVEGRLCLSGDWRKAGDWRAESLVQELPLTLMKPFLPPEVIVQGAVNSHFTAKGIGAKPLEVNGEVHTTPGRVRLARKDAESITLKFTNAQARVRLDQRQVEAEAILALAQPGAAPLQAKFVLPPLSTGPMDPNTLPVRGEITGRFNNLAPFAVFAPDIEELKGRLGIDLRIGGTLAAPSLGGQVSLDEGAVMLPQLGTQISEIQLRAVGEGRKVKLNGRMRSGEGHLEADGAIALYADSPSPIQVRLAGERFEAIKLPEVWALISPKLELTAGKAGVNVQGEVRIPEAKLEPVTKESAIPVSEDVVIVPRPAKQEEPKVPAGVTAEVRVVLGDKVSIKTKEFQSRLTGGLGLSLRPNQPPTGSGEIQMVDGVLSAYGQKLQINQGRVLFAGGPLEDPGLDIEAFREITAEQILAGVRVRGRASEPVMTLYSKPAMNQDQVLAYLLFGRPLNRLSEGQGSTLLQAASSLGGENSEFLTQRIASTFGLDEVKLTSDAETKSMGLQVGKSLAPGLSLSYGAGLAGALGKLNLRYELTKSWLLQVETGARTGVDILYSVER
jgi:translocation and assembly module TamB